MDFESSSPESTWDGRQHYQQHIWKLYNAALLCRVNDKYDNWYDCLAEVYSLLYPRMKEENRVKIRELLKRARGMAKVSHLNLTGVNLIERQVNSSSLYYTLIDRLTDIDIELKSEMDRQGLMNPKAEDASNALIGNKR